MGPRERCILRPRSWVLNPPSCGSDEASAVADADLDRTRTSISCGGSRDSSPAPSANSCYSSAPGDSETFDTEGDASLDEGPLSPIRAWIGKRPCLNMPASAGKPKFVRTRKKQHRWNNRAAVWHVCIFFANWGQRTWQQGGAGHAKIDAQIKKAHAPSLA